MNRSTKQRVPSDARRQPAGDLPAPHRAAAKVVSVNPPAKRPWFLVSGVAVIVAWIAFLAILAFGRL